MKVIVDMKFFNVYRELRVYHKITSKQKSQIPNPYNLYFSQELLHSSNTDDSAAHCP